MTRIDNNNSYLQVHPSPILQNVLLVPIPVGTACEAQWCPPGPFWPASSHYQYGWDALSESLHNPVKTTKWKVNIAKALMNNLLSSRPDDTKTKTRPRL